MKILFYITIVINGLPLAMISPFYPPLASDRGMSTTIIGLIMAMRPIGQMFSTSFMGKFLNKKNYFKALYSGLVIQGVSIIGFALTYYIYELNTLTIVSFVSRFVCGIGSGMFFLSFNSLIPILFPDTIEQTFAIMESGSGLGFVVGPLVGALLYSLFGYFWMFIIDALSMFLFIPLLHWQRNRFQKKNIIQKEDPEKISISKSLLEQKKDQLILDQKSPILSVVQRSILKKSENNEDHQNQQQDEESDQGLIKLICVYFKDSLVIISVLNMTITNFCWFVLEPVYSIFLIETYQAPQQTVAIIMSILPVLYVISSFIAQYLMSYKHQVIVSQLLIMGISFLLAGPSQNLIQFLPKSIVIVIISQIIMGFSMGMIYAMMQPFCYSVLLKVYNLSKEQASKVSATYYTIFTAFGSLVAPNAGGYFYNILGFELEMGLVGIIIAAYGVVTLLVMISKKKYL